MISQSPLDQREREELERSLASGKSRNSLRTLAELDGLFCAVAIGPNLVSPIVWLRLIHGDGDPPFRSAAAAQRFGELTMRHYNDVVRSITLRTYSPLLPERAPRGGAHRAQPWARGFLAGMSLDEEWRSLLANERDSTMLAPILLLADASLVVRDGTLDGDQAEEFIAMVPHVIPIIRDFWQSPRTPNRRKVATAEPKNVTIHRLKIQLMRVKPPVWRRVEIRSDTKLSAVGRVLLAAMGWTDTHLHAFRVGRKTFALPNPEFANDDLDERRYTLAQVLLNERDSMTFDYDFGDGWQHRVSVEAIEPALPTVKYPRCISGKRSCPPEDCGGPYGYEEFLEAIGDPQHKEHDHMREWAGEFDPASFDLESINAELRALRVR